MIHFHGTPMGGRRIDVARFMRGRFVFVPFGNLEDLPVAAEESRGFAFDNGAFTAWRSGTPITDWGPYYELVKHWWRHPRFQFAIIPDIIDGTEADNKAEVVRWCQKMPVQMELESVPVWHLHESLYYLKYLTEHFRRVAIGSSGQWSTPATESWWRRIGEAMSVLCDSEGRPRVRIHGLRMLNPEIVCRIPLSSADSTNAAQNSGLTQRFGMYTPPTSAQRAEIIASRIECTQSPAIWSAEQQLSLFDTSHEGVLT